MADRPPPTRDPLEVRVAKLEGLFEQLNERLGNVETDIRDLRQEVSDGFNEVRREMRRMLYWILGLVVVGYLVPIALRFVPGG